MPCLRTKVDVHGVALDGGRLTKYRACAQKLMYRVLPFLVDFGPPLVPKELGNHYSHGACCTIGWANGCDVRTALQKTMQMYNLMKFRRESITVLAIISSNVFVCIVFTISWLLVVFAAPQLEDGGGRRFWQKAGTPCGRRRASTPSAEGRQKVLGSP